jgi:glycosyltransferase involved in cell wall biosynthesis
MNICYICNEYPEGPHGGVGTMTKLLAEELASRGNSVKVIGVYNSDYPSVNYNIQNGVEVTRIKVNYKNRFAVLWGNWLTARKIKSWIKKNLVDIIESPDSYGMFSLFAKFKKPLVLRANGNNTYFSSILNIPLKKNTAFYERNLYKKAFAYCAVSAFTANKMKLLFNIEDSITVIYNAVAIQQDEFKTLKNYKDLQEHSNPIVFSGTLTPKKGIYELVRAMIILLNKGVEVTLIINGKDSVNIKTGKSVKSELLEMISQDLLKHFIFNGHITREELFSQYKNSKAAIFPSFAEAFALAPMEAMALGIPTIFSGECSGGELIINNEDGFLIDPSSEESIAQAIEYVIQNPTIAKQIGQKGKEKIERYFSKETMATKSIAFYEKIQNSFSAKQLHLKN